MNKRVELTMEQLCDLIKKDCSHIIWNSNFIDIRDFICMYKGDFIFIKKQFGDIKNE